MSFLASSRRGVAQATEKVWNVYLSGTYVPFDDRAHGGWPAAIQSHQRIPLPLSLIR